uniref:Small ribosomal subunit protein uS7c n=1 Tax=Trachelomonas grandis TaxID=215769 RepID=A0A385UK49_9EUGL|nr:ribosomal protein S7 [Trachelomonas grandis]
MSRKKKIEHKIIKEDPIYKSTIINMIINNILLHGKRNTAQNILYEALNNIQQSSNLDPLETINKAIKNTTPIVELKSRRIGGATYQVPIEIKPKRGLSLAIKLIVKSARKRPGKNMITKLENELIDAYNNTGNSVKRKEELHKIADANKAFSNIRF